MFKDSRLNLPSHPVVALPDGNKHALDTQKSNYIAAQNLRALYSANQRVLSDSDVKLVGVKLGARAMTMDMEDSMMEEFLEVVTRYALKNVELCTTVYGRFWGGFDDKIREYRGKVIPLT